MLFYSILKDYFEKNKANVILYIVICSIDNIVRVLVTSKIYSSFLNKDAHLPTIIKKIIMIWIIKFLLCYSKSYLESIIIPNICFFIRNKLISDYIKINEIDFNDINISTDVRQIVDVVKYIRDIIVWTSESVIPIVILMICMNGYFLIKYPRVGTINIIGNILSLYVMKNSYQDILEKSVKKEEIFLKLVDYIDQNLNNMMNIYLNNKSDDAIKKIEEFGQNDAIKYKEQYKDLEQFSTNVKIVNYIFSGLGLYTLYKCADRENFVNGLLIYTFFIQTQETIIDEIPKHIILISNIKHIENYLERKIYDRLNNLKNTKNEYVNHLDNFQGNIDLNSVCFKYEIVDISYDSNMNENINKESNNENNNVNNVNNVIDNLNLSIKSQERIALYAQSGSGKTTLMKLLLAFYTPQKGSIKLDGKDINTINPITIRNSINYINQKTILFEDTILNNMRYGNNKSQNEVIDFLKKYNLLSIFKDCDKSENTCLNNMINGNGLNMSMGMQKIIFLVRGILKDSNVYIFDEPLTSLDHNTRQNVIKMIDIETKGKTVLIITHDSEIDQIVDRKINLLEIQDKKNL
jgi:ABC-type multidrug transport system fused ATPase/permease subunit